jgi:hypothetical protein
VASTNAINANVRQIMRRTISAAPAGDDDVSPIIAAHI